MAKIVQIAISPGNDEEADVVYALDDVGRLWVGEWEEEGVFKWMNRLPALPESPPTATAAGVVG